MVVRMSRAAKGTERPRIYPDLREPGTPKQPRPLPLPSTRRGDICYDSGVVAESFLSSVYQGMY